MERIAPQQHLRPEQISIQRDGVVASDLPIPCGLKTSCVSLSHVQTPARGGVTVIPDATCLPTPPSFAADPEKETRNGCGFAPGLSSVASGELTVISRYRG